ncbi:MAG: hypothetical protein HUK19_02780, partial [Fibrobacter sp.]|nr:hypothetical protein [Fibrobacter sp.]
DYSDKEANAAAVAAFNSFRPEYVGESGKAKYAILIFGLAEDAVLEDSNISISIANRTMLSLYFRVVVKNKTDKTVYLDLANSFVSRDEVATPYYIPSATNTTHGTSSGVGVSLGIISPILSGISVGGGSSTSTSTTVFAQRVVAIPPRSVITLEDLEFFIPTRDDSKDERMRQYDEFFGKKQATGWVNPKYSSWYLNFDEDVPLQRGEWLTYDESKSDFRFGVRISYSMTEDLIGLASVDTRMYLKHVVGIKGKSGGGKEYYDDKIVSENFPGCDKILGIGMPVGYKKKYPYFQRP